MPALYKRRVRPPKVGGIADILAAFRRFVAQPEVAGYLRGQAVASWGLSTTIARPYTWGSKKKSFDRLQEQALLQRFRRFAHTYTGRTLNKWEALFLARHHGLPVRLLDWTSNPLVALFNAVESPEHFSSDGAIWLLRRTRRTGGDVDVLEDKRDPLAIPGVRLIHPSHVSQRLVVQSGCFTLHAYPWTDLTKLRGGRNVDIVRIEKLLVPASAKQDILEELMRSAINTRTLFPDLDGLARGLAELQVVRKFD